MRSELLINPSSVEEKCNIYCSLDDKTINLVNAYAETDQLSHRYLAYRDLPFFMKKYLKGKKALDYGAGTGISTHFLQTLGLNVTGVDISLSMLSKARQDFPELTLVHIEQNQAL